MRSPNALASFHDHVHLLPSADLKHVRVSKVSIWTDRSWVLDAEADCYRTTEHTINWDVPLADGSTLCDHKWAGLLDMSRRFVWSLMTDPRDNATSHSAKTIGTAISDSLWKLLRWMTANEYQEFAQLDNEASWEYRDFVVSTLAAAKPDGVSPGMLVHTLRILNLIYQQREMFNDCGLLGMPQAPYDGRSSGDIAEEAATIVNGTIPPLPDQVAISMMAAAWRLLGVPAEDVVSLLDHYVGPDYLTGLWRRSSDEYGNQYLRAFEFSTIEGETTPWHEGLGSGTELCTHSSKTIRRASIELRALVREIIAACVVILQGTTGVRISEVCGIHGGIDQSTGMPRCVKIRTSRTGLNELFYLESPVRKFHDGRVMEWVLGFRPCGNSYIPPAVHAIVILERIFARFRTDSGVDELILRFAYSGVGFPTRAGLVRPVLTDNLRDMVREDFVRRTQCLAHLPDVLPSPSGPVSLAGYKDGSEFRTHQWRKTFAQFVIQVDPRMIPALAQHFKHLSLGMTEEAYLGNDPEMQQALDSERRRRTVEFFYEQTRDSPPPLAGGMADLVDRFRQRLRKIAKSKIKEKAIPNLQHWVAEQDLRIWFTDYGKCFIAIKPAESRCHLLGESNPWLSLEPNYQFRSPSICAGCSCFAAGSEDAGFWQQRYRSNTALVERLNGDRQPEFRVALERMRQAKSILKLLKRDAQSHEAVS